MGLNLKLKHYALITIALSTGSCIKPPETAINYGPEVQANAIATEIDSALGPDDPMKINLNEYTEAQTTREIRGRAVIDILSRTSVSVTRKDLVDNQVQYYYVEDKIEYDLSGGGNDRRITRDFQECLDKDSLDLQNCLSSPTSSSEVTPSSSKVDVMQLMKAKSTDEAKVTYHNLEVYRSLESPPDLVRDFENCMGIPNCKIRYTSISYDVVDWSSKEGNKITVMLKISPDVPYLSRVMEKCQQGSIPVPQNGEPESEAPRFLLTFCDSVRNFRFGTTTN